MKLRTTTPASNIFIARFPRVAKGTFIAAVAVLLAVASIPLTKLASADQYDDKISALTRDMARYQAEADRLNGEAVSLQNTVAQIQNDKNALQSQIDLSQAKYDKLVVDIANTEADIKQNQDALGTTLADLYVSDDVSPIEMIASSNNISDYLNKQEYQNSVKDQLTSTIKTVKTLRTQLDGQKADVAKVLAQQTSDRDALAAKQAEQQNLLNQTQNDEANYQKLVSNNASEIASAKAAQAALRARTVKTGGYSLVDAGSLGSYGWSDSSCPMLGYLSTGGADGNGGDGHGYGCRQCASYVAWKVAKATGIYYQWGNGGNFANAAISAGYKNLGRNPQPGSIAVLLGNPGHVAWVEAVSPDGSHVTVSQYNYNYGAGWGMYSEMVLSSNFFDQYVKIN